MAEKIDRVITKAEPVEVPFRADRPLDQQVPVDVPTPAEAPLVPNAGPTSISATAAPLPLAYDTKTGEQAAIPFEALPDAIAAGNVGFKIGERIDMIGQDGKSYNLPAEEVRDALSSGYRLESPDEISTRKYVADNAGVQGTLKVGAGQAVDELLGGIPEIVFDHVATPLEREKKDALKADHEVANTVGGVAGFAGSLFVGSELFKGASVAGNVTERAAAKLLRTEGEALVAQELIAGGMSAAKAAKAATPLWKTVATNAAGAGVENLTQEVPKIITELALGDTDAAAEHAKYAIGVGAAFGGVTGAIGKGYSGLSKLVSESKAATVAEGAPAESWMTKLKDLAEEYSFKIQAKNAGALKSNVSKIGAEGVVDSSRILSEAGLLNNGVKNSEAVAADIATGLERGWQQMDSAISGLDARAGEIKALAAEPEQLGVIGKLEEMKDKFKYASDADKRKIIDEAIDNFESDAGLIASSETPLKELHNIRRSMDDKLAFNAADTKPLTKLKEQIRNVYSGELNKFIDNVSTKLEQPELATAWKEGNKLYSAAADYRKFLTNEQNSFIGNRMFGLTDNIAGAAGLMSVAAGNPAGLIGIAGKKALESSYGQTAIASLLYKFSQSGGENAGLLLAQKALQHGESQMKRIPEILGSKISVPIATSAPMYAVTRFLGSNSSPRSMQERQKQVDDLAMKVRELNSNPQKLTDKLAELSDPLNLGAPNVGLAYTRQMQELYQHIESIVPKNKKEINPFKKAVMKYTDTELTEFERRLAVIEDPYYVLEGIQNNTLTRGQVDTLKLIYPKIYVNLVKGVTEAANDQEKPIPYSRRLKLSLLLGEPIDKSVENVAQYQATFSGSQEDAQPQAPQISSGKPRTAKLDVVGKDNKFMTATDRLSNR